MTRVVNLTAHAVVVMDGNQALAAYPPSGTVARRAERSWRIEPLDTAGASVPRFIVSYEATVTGLPQQKQGTILIASRVLAAALARDDVYFPFGEVRDEGGRIVGCTALATFGTGGHGDA